MMNYIKKSLALSTVVAKKMATHDPHQLEKLRVRLKSLFGKPTGMHMTGIPLGISAIFALFCYAMQQVAVSVIIFKWLMIPEYKVLAGVFCAAIVYAILIVTTMFATARGSLIGFKIYLFLIALTGIVATIFFFSSFYSLLADNITNYTPQITALLGMIFLLINCKWLNSSLFYRSVALCLHNRVLRKQMKEGNH